MIRAIKSYGQNFLQGSEIPQKMVQPLDIKNGDNIIEIGPGPGAVTDVIFGQIKSQSDSTYLGIDADPRMIELLQSKFDNNQKMIFLNENILDWFREENSKDNTKIIGSLPFNITSPIFHGVINMPVLPETCVFLVQKEVGIKVTDLAPNGSYLSSIVNTFYDTFYVCSVPRGLFRPVPKVDGAVIKFTKKAALVDSIDIRKYEGFLHRAFSNPRKMLNKVFDVASLESNNIDPKSRPEHVDLTKWIDLFKSLS